MTSLALDRVSLGPLHGPGPEWRGSQAGLEPVPRAVLSLEGFDCLASGLIYVMIFQS